MAGSQLCFILVLILVIGFFVWGMSDLLKGPQPSEADTPAVISRQIRGIGLILVAKVVLLVGGVLCLGMSGSVQKYAESMKGVLNSKN